MYSSGCFDDFVKEAGFYKSPYDLIGFDFGSIESGDVLVVGSRLSAIDAAIILSKSDLNITMISSSGTLPSVRTGTPVRLEFCIDSSSLGAVFRSGHRMGFKLLYFINRIMQGMGYPVLSGQISRRSDAKERFLTEIALASSGGNYWQNFVAVMVDAVHEALVGFDKSTVDYIVSEIISVSGRYLGAVSLQNAKIIEDLMRRGAFEYFKGQGFQRLL